jgi:hypothetical protein
MPDFAWLNEQTDAARRYVQGVGPQPHGFGVPGRPVARYQPPVIATPPLRQAADKEASDGPR